MQLKNGIRPIKKDSRDLSFHRTFGALVSIFPENYDCDAGLGCPDQNNDGFPEGCSGYTQSELCQDEDGMKYKPSFTYLKTLQMEGQTDQGPCDLRDSLKSLQVFGVQGKDETTDAQAMSHKRGKYFDVFDGSGKDAFDSIRSSILQNALEKRSVSVGTPWFPEFTLTPSNGIVPIPRDYSLNRASWHNWKISGWKTIYGIPYLIGKPWVGDGRGDKGFFYFRREIINALFAINGSAGFTIRKFVPEDVQTVKLSLAQTLLSYFRMVLALIQKRNLGGLQSPLQTALSGLTISLKLFLIKIMNKPMNAEKLYEAAKASLGMDMSVNAPDELGCADAVNNIYFKAFGWKIAEPGTSTTQLFDVMEADIIRFAAVNDPLPGDIIISPTGYGTDHTQHGHMGIVAKYGILSNDSYTGTFRENFTYEGWLQYFKTKRGFPVLLYRCK